MLFKKYKNIFGLPNQGFHKIRFLDAALLDYLGTIILSIAFTISFGKNSNNNIYRVPLVVSTIFMFIIGEVLHFLFGVKTNTIIWIQKIKCI